MYDLCVKQIFGRTIRMLITEYLCRHFLLIIASGFLVLISAGMHWLSVLIVRCLLPPSIGLVIYLIFIVVVVPVRFPDISSLSHFMAK